MNAGGLREKFSSSTASCENVFCSGLTYRWSVEKEGIQSLYIYIYIYIYIYSHNLCIMYWHLHSILTDSLLITSYCS